MLMGDSAQQGDGGACAAKPVVDVPEVAKRSRYLRGRAAISVEQFGDYFALHACSFDRPGLVRSLLHGVRSATCSRLQQVLSLESNRGTKLIRMRAKSGVLAIFFNLQAA